MLVYAKTVFNYLKIWVYFIEIYFTNSTLLIWQEYKS
jgi:hypothetical protein